MLLRYRMNKIIHLLKAGNEAAVLELISSDKYRNALLALESTNSVKLMKTWGSEIARVVLLDAHAGYLLSRHDLRVNRVVSFLLGVASTVVAELLLYAILR